MTWRRTSSCKFEESDVLLRTMSLTLYLSSCLYIVLHWLLPHVSVCPFLPSHPRFTDGLFSWVYFLYIALLFIVDTYYYTNHHDTNIFSVEGH
jgi:hypothetical protein